MFKKWFSKRASVSSDQPAASNIPSQKKQPRASASKPQGNSSRNNTSRTKARNKPTYTKPKQDSNWTLEQYQIAPKEGFSRFHDLGLPLSLIHAVADLGFEYCSPVQAEALPHTLDGFDTVAKAQTGTGKTAAFLLTALNDLISAPIEGERYLAEPRVVVIAPTRELVVQIGKDAIALAKYTGLNVQTLIGGVDYQSQKKRMQNQVVDIIAATPGRLIDFLTRGDISLALVDVLVLDEADRMLDMGFIPQVRQIVRATPNKDQRQTLMFSATFNYDVNTLVESWTTNPVRIEIEPENIAADSVDQKVYMVSSEEKFSILKSIVSGEDVSSVIVFANRRDQTRKLYEKLKAAGIHCGILSGEIPQHKRTRTLEQFKTGKIKILIATDVAGRGIHIDGISHVINYNLPEDPEDYVHRIGRTGRAGAKGISISLACEDDAFMLPDIEALLGEKLNCERPPSNLYS